MADYSRFLSTTLDVAASRERLEAQHRVTLKNVLEDAVAADIYEELVNTLDWELSLTTKAGPAAIDAGTLASATELEKDDLRQQIVRQATTRFSYCYGRYELIPGEPEHLLQARDYLSSTEFIEFMHDLTGDNELVRADAHATVYNPGYFLKKHDDTYAGKSRRFAYVYGFTRDWQADWGGLLCFLDKKGMVEDVLIPGYNTLTVFSVPQDHFVSVVSQYAGSKRLAITGWLFAED